MVNYLKTIFTSGPLAAYWLFALGTLFVIVTLALPKGILGVWDQFRNRWNAKAVTDAAKAR